MSRTIPQEKRLRLFEQGNTHCPICLTEFTEPEVRAGEAVTLEHAPQESLGGKPACLTCMQCNTGPATGMMDQAVARFYRAQEQGGYPITVEGDGKRPYTVHPKHYDIEKDRIRIRTRRDVVGKSDGPFTLRQTEPWPDAVRLGVLKSAYLMVFSLLGAAGYRYAQGEAVTSIRDMLLSPEKGLVRPFVAFHADTANTEHAVLLWTEYQCWAVKICTDVVILPPGGSIDRYRRLAAAIEPPLRLGSTVQWTAPKFGGSPIPGKKSDALKTKHLFGATLPNRRQDYVVVYEEADMVAVLPVSGPSPSSRRST
ncbi:MAG: hypothetical protein OXI50_15250 [Gammaproteobacteria bacterium]|nr:hypothetical protein [Gammaproteobacteria bacterium]